MRLAMLLLLWVWTMVAQGDELPPWVSPEGHDDPHAGMVLDTANGIWLTPVRSRLTPSCRDDRTSATLFGSESM